MLSIPPELYSQLVTNLPWRGRLRTRLLCVLFENLFHLPPNPAFCIRVALLLAGAERGQIDRYIHLLPGGLDSVKELGTFYRLMSKPAKQLVVSLFSKQDITSLDWLRLHVFPAPAQVCHDVFHCYKVRKTAFCCSGTTMIRYLAQLWNEPWENMGVDFAVECGNLDYLKEVQKCTDFSLCCALHCDRFDIANWLLDTFPISRFDLSHIPWYESNFSILQRVISLISQTRKLKKSEFYHFYTCSTSDVQRLLLQIYPLFISHKRFTDSSLLDTYLRNFDRDRLLLLLEFFPSNASHFTLTDLLSATGNGDLDIVKAIYTAVKRQFQDHTLQQLCRICARHGHLDVLNYFLEQEADRVWLLNVKRLVQCARSKKHPVVARRLDQLLNTTTRRRGRG